MIVLSSSSQTSLLSLFLFGFVVLFVSFKWISSYSKNKKSSPPSPPGLPIIGNFHQLGLRPRESLRDLSQQYGPLMLLHLGSTPTLIVSSAEVAKEVMKTHDLAFSDRPSLVIPDILFYGSKDIAFSRYGEYWRQLKSIVVLHLLSANRVKSFRQVRAEEVGNVLDALKQSCGSSVDMSALLGSYTSNALCRVAFGRTYDGLGFTNKLKKFVDLLGTFCIGSFIPWLSWVDRLSGIHGKAKAMSKDIDDFLVSVVEDHLVKKKINDQGEVTQDFVDILREIQNDKSIGFTLSTDTLKAVILDVFVAGSDTIFSSLDWALSELIKHPRAMKKLQEEASEIGQGRPVIPEEDLDHMTYLKAVVKEALRLHSPLPLLLPRESRQQVNLMGYDIPKNTQVIINAWAINRDPTTWNEAEEFKPERFLNNPMDYKGLHYEFLPFGAGRRGCPGLHFGVVLLELVLANLVYKFNFELPNGVDVTDLDMTEANGVTVQRKTALIVVPSPRF
ncbi:cytochrome P450 Tp4149-like [Rutidosis leptorrhynchoides]|uniref:cytochrome P450 Tp4149-like n=1 Tax=Rutidosis leptorrhynchoides TaxID=125765 RepID=UPI003A99DE0C